MGSPPTPGTATPSYTTAASSMTTAKYLDALDEEAGPSGSASPKSPHSQHPRKGPKRRSKAAPRLNQRLHGPPYYKGRGGRATSIRDVLRDWLPLQLFEHGHKAPLPNAEASRKAEHQDGSKEHTTTREMRHCSAVGEMSPASGAGGPTSRSGQRVGLLHNFADNRSTAAYATASATPMRARKAARAARSDAPQTSDTAAPDHRTVAQVSVPPAPGQQQPARRQPRPRAARRRPEARVNTGSEPRGQQKQARRNLPKAMGSPPSPGTATPSYTTAASSMTTAKHVEALDEEAGPSGSASPKSPHSQHLRKALKKRSKAAPRLNHRFQGAPYYKGRGGRAPSIRGVLRDWLPLQLFEHGHKAPLPNAEASRKAEHQDGSNEHTTTREMRHCSAVGVMSQASGAGGRTSGLGQRVGPLHNFADNTTTAAYATATDTPTRARKAAWAARSDAPQTSDTAASAHRSVARVSVQPAPGQQEPAGRQPRPRAARRRPEARVTTFLQPCMFLLSTVLVVLLLPALILLTPYMRGAGAAAAYAGGEALETVQPVLTYRLPNESASHCVRRRRLVVDTSATPVNVNAARTAFKASLRLPVIRRRRLVCLYKEAPDTMGLLEDLFSLCTDVVYGQFYLDKAGLLSKQPTLARRLPDKSRYAHAPRLLGWMGGELGDAGDFSRLARESATTLQGFVRNFTSWLQAWSFDGAHLDWRYPGGPCEVDDDFVTFVRLLQFLRHSTRLLSVALPYKEAMLAKRFDISNIASLADMLVVNTDETLAEDYTGQPSCPGAALPQVAASLWRVRRMMAAASELQQQQTTANLSVQLCHTVSLASVVYYRSFAQPSNLSKGLFVVSSVVPYSDHCLNKAGYRNQPLLNEPGCTALVRESNSAPRVIASAGPDDLRRRLEQAYVVHDFGHECVAAAALAYDDYAGHCGLGRWPLLRALY
ncbi:uncharacterized protein [Dermacentor albipictus]|uniref:uncharacterized protein n=1 Tax=Dermacentor albipictus TaxID=60249 RepID=UPI0038FD25E0